MPTITGTFVVGQPANNQSEKVYNLNLQERVNTYVRGENGQQGTKQWTTNFYTAKIFASRTATMGFVQSLKPGDTVEVVGELEIGAPREYTNNQGQKVLKVDLTILPDKLKRPEMSKDTKERLGIINDNGNGAQGYGIPPPSYQQPQQPPQPAYVAPPPPMHPGAPQQPGGYPPPGPQYQQPGGYAQAPQQPPVYAPPPPQYPQQPGQPQQGGYPQQPQQAAPVANNLPPQRAPVNYMNQGDDFSDLQMPPDDGQS